MPLIAAGVCRRRGKRKGSAVSEKITTCLWFDSQAEEAAEYYVSIFDGGKILDVSRYGDGGPGPAGQAITVQFLLDGPDLHGIERGSGLHFQ